MIASRQCSAVRKDGTHCPNPTKGGKDVCGVHLRSQRHSITKAAERAAMKVSVYAKVASAAVNVGVAAHAIASHWDRIVKVLSYFVNFVWEFDEGHNRWGANVTRENADQLSIYALAFVKATNRAELQTAACGFENSAIHFLHSAKSLDRECTIASIEYEELQFAITHYDEFVEAHQKLVAALFETDLELGNDLAKQFSSYGRHAVQKSPGP